VNEHMLATVQVLGAIGGLGGLAAIGLMVKRVLTNQDANTQTLGTHTTAIAVMQSKLPNGGWTEMQDELRGHSAAARKATTAATLAVADAKVASADAKLAAHDAKVLSHGLIEEMRANRVADAAAHHEITETLKGLDTLHQKFDEHAAGEEERIAVMLMKRGGEV